MSKTNEPSAEALAEQIGAVEETIAELQVDPLLYHEQAGPVIDLRIARLTAVIATLKERDAAYCRGIEAAAQIVRARACGYAALPGSIFNSELITEDLSRLEQRIRALAPPQEG